MAEEKKEFAPIYYDSPEKAYRESVTSPEADAFRTHFTECEKCVRDIEDGVKKYREEKDGFTVPGFLDKLVEKYGADRVKYVLATNITTRGLAEDFSEEAREWAKDIKISESYLVNDGLCVKNGNDFVNALALDAKERLFGLSPDTPVFTEEPQKDVKPDKETLTLRTDEEKKIDGVPVTKNGDGSVTVRMPWDAVIRRYQTSAVLCMPRNRGYDSFRYMVDVRCFRENGDGTVNVTMATNDAHTLTIRRRGEEARLSSDELYGIFSNTTREDFVPVKYTISVPNAVIQGNYPNMIRCKFPEDSTYAGQHYVVPSVFKDTEASDGEKTVFSIPDYMNFSVRDAEGEDKLIPVSELAKETDSAAYRVRKPWTHVNLPGEAVVCVYDKHTLLKMPNGGEYDGFSFYLPNGMCPVDEKDGLVKIKVPSDREIQIKNAGTGETKKLTGKQLSEATWGKTSADFAHTPAFAKKKKDDGPAM